MSEDGFSEIAESTRMAWQATFQLDCRSLALPLALDMEREDMVKVPGAFQRKEQHELAR